MALDDISLSLGSCQAAGKTTHICHPTAATLFSKSSSRTFISQARPTAAFISHLFLQFSFSNKYCGSPVFAVAYIQRGPGFF